MCSATIARWKRRLRGLLGPQGARPRETELNHYGKTRHENCGGHEATRHQADLDPRRSDSGVGQGCQSDARLG